VNGYVVVDASLAMKWVLKELYAGEALALVSDWAATETRLAAPCLVLVKATSVLQRRAVVGQISPSQAKQLLGGLLNMCPEVRESVQVDPRAAEVAQELHTPAVHDVHYPDLADILERDLWTAHEGFLNSVKEQQPRVKWLISATRGEGRREGQ